MQVSLIQKERISSITLPEKVHGQYWITQINQEGFSENVIGIEGGNGVWKIKTNKCAQLLSPSKLPVREIAVVPNSFYDVRLKSDSNDAVIYVEKITDNRQTFHCYTVSEICDIEIGRAPSNDICFAAKYVSQKHAVLRYRGSRWYVTDQGSTNGTYLNNNAVEKLQALHPGDVLYIMGLKLIIGSDYIALNNPDGLVTINEEKLKLRKPQIPSVYEEEEIVTEKTNYFYRSPRFMREIHPAVMRVDAPPNNQIGDEMPLMLLIGPSITMGMASIATGTFTIVNALSTGNIRSAIPSAIMSFSMLLGTMLWPILSKRYEKRRNRKKEALRQNKYTKYLDTIRQRILSESKKQAEIIHENAISSGECREKIELVDRTLWERGTNQSDFLTFRLGLGDRPLSIDLHYQERKFSLDDDNLIEDMYDLCESKKELHDVPITISFIKNHIVGLIGNRPDVMTAINGILLQLVAFYGYDEVKCVFLYNPKKDSEMRFVKWLPHVWDIQKNHRLIATTSNELKDVSVFLEREIESRLNLSDEERNEIYPFYLIFAMDRELSNKAEVLRQVFNAKKNIHFGIISCFDELKNLPKECSTVIEYRDGKGKIFTKDDTSGSYISFSPDAYVGENWGMLSIAKRLANIELDIDSVAYKLPQMLTFTEMFGVGKVEHLNALSRWHENDPTKSLETPVGVNTLGDRFMLDLHQNFHGPHGLIAGMTGSGKSEFVMTYILSLAVNYHPHEVSFILIDYKGGGMAKTFLHLPHTAGIITNLDGNEIKRSLLSIESELKRRETLFSQTSTLLGTSNLDIYKYQKLYREGLVSEPLSHLFIISDEFAELKTQQPEFMEHLISAARIGRSLGVHLILATQKPAGVVDDQIWSNSKFRVCLKVQDRADSMDMLKRPDAAELTQTGRFFLQVGYNEMFELGQSAWAGAPYYPSDQLVAEQDISISVIDMTGQPLKQLKLDKHSGEKADKQVDVVTSYLEGLAKEANVFAKPLWLPTIPKHILMENIRREYTINSKRGFVLNPLIGLYDDPVHQQQCPLTLPLTAEGNAVIYGAAGSGKTSFLNALIYSLISEHTPNEVNLYIMDFASETLSAFVRAPHVGDVVFSSEREKVDNLFKMLYSEINRRRKLFSQYGGEYQAYIEKSGETLPNFVVIIHNYSAFSELFEDKEDALSFLAREGRKYGLYFVLSALTTGTVRFRLLQNFKQLLTMQLNDENEYSTVVGKTEGLIPSKCKGRGLTRINNAVLEFQTASMTEDSVPAEFLKSRCERIRTSWKGACAKRIPILPEHVDVDFMRSYYDPMTPLQIPIGVEASTLNIHYYPFDSKCISLLLSTGTDTEAVLAAVANLVASAGKKITILDSGGTLYCDKCATLHHITSTSDVRAALHSLVLSALERNHAIAQAKQDGSACPVFEQQIYLINSLTNLISDGDEDDVDALKVFFEKLSTEYNMFFIVAEAVKNLTAFSFEKWYKRHISQMDCIWVGNGFLDQYQMKASRQTPELRGELGADFGISLKNGVPVKIKILRCTPEEV